jgi:hypothetical protein
MQVAIVIVAVVSRYLIASGMTTGPTPAKRQPLRFVGALGTYLTGILLCFGGVHDAGMNDIWPPGARTGQVLGGSLQNCQHRGK